jgi:hypothetical protein
MHRYLGLFFAPTILFFAITGGSADVRVARDRSWQFLGPPNILAHHLQLHKKGTLYLPPRKAAPNLAKSDGAKLDAPKLETPMPAQAAAPPNSLPVKIFFAATAPAVSTCAGLIMGWKYARR